MIEIWITDARGERKSGPRFRFLGDALRFVNEHARPDLLAVRLPDGRWYDSQQRYDPSNRRQWSRARLARRGSLELVDDRRSVTSDIIVLDGSLGGLRVRLVSPDAQFRTGWDLRCSLISSHRRLIFSTRVAWVAGRTLGLQLAHEEARGEFARWISDESGANTPPFGLRIVEK